MIAILKTGRYFQGAVRYVLGLGKDAEHKRVEVLAHEGIDVKPDNNEKGRIDPEGIANSFDLQACLNPRVKKVVRHTVLSWEPEDEPRLDNREMVAAAREFIKRMGYDNTQYLVVRHLEKDNPHVHIIYNSVGNNGKRLNDYMEKRRSAVICRAITEEREYTLGRHASYNKSDIPLDGRNRVRAAARYAIAKAVMVSVGKIRDIEELQRQLMLDGSGVRAMIQRDNSGRPVGISFSKQMNNTRGERRTITFAGGSIDKKMTLGNLKRWISEKETLNKYLGEAQAIIEEAGEIGISGPCLSNIKKHVWRISEERKRIITEKPPGATNGYVNAILAMLFLDRLLDFHSRLSLAVSARRKELEQISDRIDGTNKVLFNYSNNHGRKH